MAMARRFLVPLLMAWGAAGQSSDESRWSTGKGFGLPLYAFGAKHMLSEPDKLVDVPAVDLSGSQTRASCMAGTQDSKYVESNDANRASKMFFTRWIQEQASRYEKEGTGGRRELNIFLPNTMVTMTPANMDTYPARCVGRLVSPAGTCSATIVHRDLVLTNRHCIGVTGSNTLPDGWWSNTYLQVGLTQSEINYKAYFGRIRWSSTNDDYAILQLLEPLGDYTGWPGIQFLGLISFLNQPKSIAYVGYSGVLGGNAGGVFPCSTKNGLTSWDDVWHDCDATRGSSGSALMTGFRDPNIGSSTTPYIIALNYGEYRDGGSTSLTLNGWESSHRNVAKPASVFGTDFWNAVAWADMPTLKPTTVKPTTASPTYKPSRKPTAKPIKFSIVPVLAPTKLG